MKHGIHIASPVVNSITYFLESRFFPKGPKNSDFSRHFQFHGSVVQNACEISLVKVIRLYNRKIRQTIHFNNTRMLMSAFFKDIFQQVSRFKKASL